MITIQASEQDEGLRADVFLAGCGMLPLSRSALARLLAEGRVTDRGKAVGKGARLTGHECFQVELPEPEPALPPAQDIPLQVVYEDADLLVIDKPRGMVVHPSHGHEDGTLVNALLHHCEGSLSGIGGVKRPGIVHRLDKDTAGLMLAAKNDFTHEALSRALAAREIVREYDTVIQGHLPKEETTVNAPIGRHPQKRQRMAVVPGGRSAITHMKTLEHFSGYSYVSCRLETGRTHQIRVHMSYLGHPIVGDLVYGGRELIGWKTQCLRARMLAFPHPRTGEHKTFMTEPPEEFQAILRYLRALR